MMNKNPYQVICKGVDCEIHDMCGSSCILKNKFKKHLKGCNYSKEGDCKYCSHRNQCILIKPYSEKLREVEIKRRDLDFENKLLYSFIDEWDEIERNLEKYKKENNDVNSVTDVIYFPKNKNTRQKMFERIEDNKDLINLYDKLIKDM